METELCHFTSFSPNTPSNTVQGPHWHLPAGFGDPISEEGGCDQALVGTCQDLQPRSKAGAWLFPVITLLGRLGRPLDIKHQVLDMLNLCSDFLLQCEVCAGSETPLALCNTWEFKPELGLSWGCAWTLEETVLAKVILWQEGPLLVLVCCAFFRKTQFLLLFEVNVFLPSSKFTHVFWFYLVGGRTKAEIVAR